MPETIKSASISRLNDLLRTQAIGGRVVATLGVQNLSHGTRGKVVEAIRVFDKFDEGDDPYKEHDFGAVEIEGDKFYFKIDYYVPSLKFGSEDPSDPEKTTRVMTTMRADEY